MYGKSARLKPIPTDYRQNRRSVIPRSGGFVFLTLFSAKIQLWIVTFNAPAVASGTRYWSILRAVAVRCTLRIARSAAALTCSQSPTIFPKTIGRSALLWKAIDLLPPRRTGPLLCIFVR